MYVIVESLCYMPETDIILYIDYTLMKVNNKIKKLLI